MKFSRPIAISLSPNVEEEDLTVARRVLLRPYLWRKENILKTLEKHISDYFQGSAVILTSSGRQALYDLLRAARIGAGDEVIVQAFTCIAVPAPVLWAGATPVYADVDQKTYNLDPAQVQKKITPDTKAIIVQHTFGIPGPLQELRTIADDNNLLLIEDCAHALGGTYEGKSLGLFGDAAILSFGRDKILSSVFGGAIVTKNQELLSRLKTFQENRNYPPFLWIAKQLFHPLAMNTILPRYFYGIGKVILVVLQKLYFLSKAVEVKERAGGKPRHIEYRYSPALAILARNQWKKLDRFSARRKEIVGIYERAFGQNTPSALLRYPLRIESRNEILMKARQENMLLGDWYDGPLAPKTCALSEFHYTLGLCPEAEKAAGEIINLPTYPLLSNQQVEHVISFIKKFR